MKILIENVRVYLTIVSIVFKLLKEMRKWIQTHVEVGIQQHPVVAIWGILVLFFFPIYND